MAIIRGTTPTIIFKFSAVNVSEITVAYLVIKQAHRTIIERNLTSALVGEDSISWKLTQNETLSLVSSRQCEIYCDWLLNNGTRGRSVLRVEDTEDSGKNEVI